MNQKLIDFKQKILEEPLSKTDKYWLEQVDFRTNHENELNLFLNSDLILIGKTPPAINALRYISDSYFF